MGGRRVQEESLEISQREGTHETPTIILMLENLKICLSVSHMHNLLQTAATTGHNHPHVVFRDISLLRHGPSVLSFRLYV